MRKIVKIVDEMGTDKKGIDRMGISHFHVEIRKSFYVDVHFIMCYDCIVSHMHRLCLPESKSSEYL